MATNVATIRFTSLGVLDQVAQAAKPTNRLAFIIGSLLGGFIPVASYTVCHLECQADPRLWILVLAGLTYSAFTVYQWAKVAFSHGFKALGFVVLTEGIILFAHTRWLSVSALVVLILINAIATATNLIADRRQNRKVKV